jgi:hypothetical protein
VIATKFGFEDGNSQTGMDSRPQHIRQLAEGSLQRLEPTTSTSSINTVSTRTCRWKTWPDLPLTLARL